MKIQNHHTSIVSSPSFWDESYNENAIGWDLGTATPVFVELIQSQKLKPCRVCILGSGLGHDVIYFAQHGFDVVSVEFSEAAAKL